MTRRQRDDLILKAIPIALVLAMFGLFAGIYGGYLAHEPNVPEICENVGDLLDGVIKTNQTPAPRP